MPRLSINTTVIVSIIDRVVMPALDEDDNLKNTGRDGTQLVTRKKPIAISVDSGQGIPASFWYIMSMEI